MFDGPKHVEFNQCTIDNVGDALKQQHRAAEQQPTWMSFSVLFVGDDHELVVVGHAQTAQADRQVSVDLRAARQHLPQP